MRILLVVPSISVGGPQLGAIKLIREIQSQYGFKCSVLSARGHYRHEQELENEFRALGVKIYFLPYIYLYDTIPYPIARVLMKLIETVSVLFIFFHLIWHKYDIVNSHTSYAIDCIAITTRIMRLSTVFTFQGAPEAGRFHRIKRAIRLCNRRNTLFTAVSQVTKQELITQFDLPPSWIRVVPNAINLSSFRVFTDDELNSVRNELRLKRETIVFGCVGRLSTEKGQNLLIEAAEKLQRSYNEFCVLLVGDGPIRQNLEKLVEDRHIRPYVKFLGYRPDVMRLMQIMDVFVLPSYTEGLSNALIEAAATGLPCVATDVGGVRDILDETSGIIVETTVDAILSGMVQLLDYSARLEFGSAAKQKSKAFDIRHIAQQYVEVFIQLRDSAGIHNSLRQSTQEEPY